MTRLAIAGVALTLGLLPATAMAQIESGAPPMLNQSMMAPQGVPPRPNLPPMAQQPLAQSAMSQSQVIRSGGNRWSNVPGGWGAYQRPVYGYTLPRYWLSAPFFVSNWNLYGLPQPSAGFGWSRYYDDVVLTDSYGRVYDWRDNIDWSREQRWSSEDYSDSYGYRDEPRRRNNGIAGTVIGGVVGGVAGSAIAGSGNRVLGGLVGGTVGAIAGSAIEKSANSRRGNDGYRDGYRSGGYSDGSGWRSGRGPSRTADGRGYTYEGQWTGSWDGGPTRTYQGRFDGQVRPHWTDHSGGFQQQPGYGYGAGYGYGGGWMEGPPVTTVIVTQGAPVVTKTVSYVTEYVHVTPRRRVYRAPTKDRCLCGR